MKKAWRFHTAHIAIVIGSLLVAESMPVRAATQITGVTQTTEAHSDLAIDGPGWFILRDGESNAEQVTRHGEFRVDINGYLTSVHGFRVQGLKNASLTLHGDLVIDRAGAPPATDPSAHIESFTIDSTGLLWVRLADGTRFIRGQILLQNFAEPDRLTRLAYRLYGSQAAAQPRGEPGPPGSAGLGLIRSGELEIDPEPMRLTAWSASLQTGPRAEGLLTWTRNPTDLGIQGDGFFIVRDPITGESFATRAGAFVLDRDGWLVTYQGKRVQGYTDPALTEVGDVRIDGLFRPAAADPSAEMSDFDVDWNGYVRVRLSDGTRYIRGQVLRRSFARPNQLQSVGYGLLTSLDAAQPGGWLQSGRPYLSGIRSGMLELVNVPDDVLAQRRTFTWFPQGPITRTLEPLDLAISGPGFFVVKSPESDAWRVTRTGHFHLDGDGFLTTPGGLRLQGFSDPALTLRGDLRIDGQGRPANADPTAVLAAHSVDLGGIVRVRLTDGTEFVRGQILLQQFLESYRLKSDGSIDGTYTNVLSAIPKSSTGVPGTQGLGIVAAGALELSSEQAPLTPPLRGGFRLVASGEPGGRWTLQASPDLQNWTSISVVNNAPDQWEFSVPKANPTESRFFRVLVE